MTQRQQSAQDLPPDDDMPLRLAVAASVCFPAGSGVTEATLRRMAAKGKLVIEEIAGKHFTTRAAIKAMRVQCRPAPNEMLYQLS